MNQYPIDPTSETVHDERQSHDVVVVQAPAVWEPPPAVMQEFRWATQWLESEYWNPMPWIRESYASGGVVWVLMICAYLGFILSFAAYGW